MCDCIAVIVVVLTLGWLYKVSTASQQNLFDHFPNKVNINGNEELDMYHCLSLIYWILESIANHWILLPTIAFNQMISSMPACRVGRISHDNAGCTWDLVQGKDYSITPSGSFWMYWVSQVILDSVWVSKIWGLPNADEAVKNPHIAWDLQAHQYLDLLFQVCRPWAGCNGF